MRDNILYLLLGGFVGGVFLRSFVDVGANFSVFLVFVGVVLGLSLYFQHTPPRLRHPSSTEEGKKTPPVMLVGIFIFAAGLGILRFELEDALQNDTALRKSIGQTVVVRGLVSDEPDMRESQTRLTVSLREAGEEALPVKTKALVTTSLHTSFQYGDWIEIRGKLERPENFTNAETGREVDYVNFLAKEGIRYEFFRPTIILLERGQGNYIKEKLFALKHAFVGKLSASIKEPESSLLGGLLLGTKQSLGKDLLEDFRKAGVIHIVVLSGYNITIVAEAVMKFFGSIFSRVASMSFGAVSIILFAIMTGASATVVRASIMALLVILARSTRRTYQITRALLFAGFLMVLHNPKILVFDTSFQLSFLATVALIYVSPFVEKKLSWLTERWKIREVVTATVATQVFVLPFILYKIGEISIVALPVNLLVLFFVPMMMFFGFLTGVFGFFGTTIAAPFAFITYGLLAYALFVVEWFASLPFAAMAVPSFPLWLMLALYATYGIFLAKAWRTPGLEIPSRAAA